MRVFLLVLAIFIQVAIITVIIIGATNHINTDSTIVAMSLFNSIIMWLYILGESEVTND
jgi:hypothetical protein